jgi:P-type Cu2+ transporter
VSCCAPGTESALELADSAIMADDEFRAGSRDLGDGIRQTDLSVPAVHCGACISTIEQALNSMDGIASARVNLSTRRVSVQWHDAGKVPPIAAKLASLGYPAHLFDFAADQADHELKRLLKALAISGFAAMNIMLLSVSVWSGAEASTRDLFHWISAMIAIPALIWSGRIFFSSAWNALRHGRTNMDVPISIGVSLAYGMSLYETINHGHHAYFDAAVSLLFFLLIGRTLDHVMREKARTAVKGLARLSPRGALVEGQDGSRTWIPVKDIVPGMRVLIAAGERIAVDGKIAEGRSSLDCSLVTGESLPQEFGVDDDVRAGTLNLGTPLVMVATASADRSFLAEMIRLMETAEGGKARYRRIADRASQLYAPVVHLTAFLAFLGWMYYGGDWHQSITIAVAVLIVTCPCALGLAVPIVQVVAARRLFEQGIMVKDGSAMERLAEVKEILFDKTGTLTLGKPRLVSSASLSGDAAAAVSALASASRHPLSRAMLETMDALKPAKLDKVREITGLGVEGHNSDGLWRMGRRDWALEKGGKSAEHFGTETVLSLNGIAVADFQFADSLRPGAKPALTTLRTQGLPMTILSGDTYSAVSAVASNLGITEWHARLLPSEKLEIVESRAAAGSKALMVGDGLNDAPALRAAHVSMAPATAADIGRNAADFVFLRDSLAAIPFAFDIARRSGALIRQNFAIAVLYNLLAVPLAVFGYVTPLVAALAMSGSSILVVANAMRLMRGNKSAELPSLSYNANAFPEPAE